MIDSYRVTAIIYVAARLGIADILTNGPKSSDELALEVGAHEPSLRRLLRALLTVGVCRSTHENQFELTEIGRHLADGANQSLKPWVLFEGGMCWRFWGTLLDSVRTGKTAPQLAGFDSVFDMMRESPENVATFNAAMAAFSGAVIPGVLAAYDFSGITRLIDVGGGHGQLLCAILKANPSLRGCVFDQPRCADGAKRRLVEAGVSERSEFVAGNFFEGIPDGADAVILKSVIHDWDDEKSAKILRNCRLALPAEGRLLLVERLMTAKPQVNNEDRSVVLSDLNMMLIPGGVERTEDEYRELLDSSGFKMTRTLPAGRVNVIECTLA
ncbi:MAG TPA: methyltransferase [Candidatus Cybelea sp.]